MQGKAGKELEKKLRCRTFGSCGVTFHHLLAIKLAVEKVLTNGKEKLPSFCKGLKDHILTMGTGEGNELVVKLGMQNNTFF